MDIRNFGFLLKDVSRLYIRHFERHTGEIGVTLPQAKVLAFLSRNEGMTQVQLAEVSETDPMTLVRILDRMEKDGWIERRSDAGDRRVRRLHLRAPVRPVLDSIAGLAKRARAVALAGLSTADHEHLMRLLEQMHRNLSEEEDAASTAEVPRAPRRPVAARRRTTR